MNSRSRAANASWYLPADAWVVLLEPDDLHEQGKVYLERADDRRGLFSLDGVFKQLLRFPSVYVSSMPAAPAPTNLIRATA